MSANQERTGKAIELAEESDFSLGKLLVRPSCREIVCDGSAETIEPRVMQVLVALSRRRGDVVSRELLTELCWGGRFVSEDALNRSMTKVRKLSAPDAFTLETIPRVGYRLVAAQLPVPPAMEPQSRPQDTAPESAVPLMRLPARRRRWLRWTVGVAALIGLMIIGTSIGFYHQLNRPYFAVLPFDVVGADARASTLASAVPAAIATQLRTQGYKLVPLSEAASYGGDRKAVAEDLNARYLVDGSVRIERDRVRVAARIDAAGSVTVWSQEFVVDATDATALSEHIAMTISSLFNPGVRMLFDNPPQTTAAIMRIGSRMRAGDDLGAYVAARETWRQSPTTRVHVTYYAIAAGAALDILPEQERSRALREARAALASVMDNSAKDSPMASFGLTPPVEWAQREAILREGLNLPFSDASGLRRLLATQLANSGRLAEALAVSEQALGFDRSSSSNMTTNAYALDTMGRAQELDTVIARARRYWPGNEFVERTRFSAALARQDVPAMQMMLTDPVVGPVLDPPADARPLSAIARAMQTRAPHDIDRVEAECADPTKIARDRSRFCVHALVLLDRIDSVFALAPLYFPEQRGASAEDRDERWLADPRVLTNARVLFRSDTSELRTDDRLIPVLERLGLVDYWRTSGVWPDFCSNEQASVCTKLQKQ